jgi:hypothetical protein
MSDSMEQLSSKGFFDVAVRTYDRKLSGRFQALLPYKDGIADLRAKQASFRTIAQILKQAGVNVSHDTVARFCHVVVEQTQPRKKARQTLVSAPSEERGNVQTRPTSDASNGHGVSALLQERRKADAAAVKPSARSRGPRIADPGNI